jgi:hypothetical protein
MRTFIAAGVLATASCAHAQTWEWIATPSGPTDIEAGEEITWTLSALMTPPDGMEFVGLSATIFDIVSVLNGEAGEITQYEVLNQLCELTQCKIWDNGHEIYGIAAGQLVVFGPFTPDNPIDVFEFTWKAADDPGFYEVDYATETEAAEIWANYPGEDPVSIDVADITEASMHWTVNVPSPAAPGVLAGVVGWGVRRRR